MTSDITLLEKWEPLLTNLGHVARKLKKYEEALEYHQKALVLSPLDPSTLSAIGTMKRRILGMFVGVCLVGKKYVCL